MKKRFLNTVMLLFVATVLLCSCQKESEVLVDETNEEEVIEANSQLARWLVSASQDNGSVDNILDGSSCTRVVLPVTVLANNNEVVVETLEDLQLIQAIWDQYANDTDTLVINFPITLVFEDYYEEEVDSQEDLEDEVSDCQNLIDDTYTCVDFNYPISCFTYNAANEQTGRVTLNDDEEWFYYLNYLTSDISIAIDYAMEVVINGTTTQVANNAELLALFGTVDCEIDDPDPIDPEIEVLRNRLKDGSWYIAQFLDSGDDETAVFSGYDFTFLDGITVYATNGSQTVNGIWVVTLDNDELNFRFDMDSPLNDADDDDYEVLSQTDNEIVFVTRDSGGAVEDTLQFIKN